jgi:hypothetical protein
MGFMSSHKNLTSTTETQEGSTNIKSHLATTRPRIQARKIVVRDCLGKPSVYTHLVEGQPAYVHDCQGKKHVYVSKNKARQGKRMKNQTQIEKRLSSNDTTRNTIGTRAI